MLRDAIASVLLLTQGNLALHRAQRASALRKTNASQQAEKGLLLQKRAVKVLKETP